MIDLGLTKLVMIGAVALIVIGPKDLPKVARMAGTLLGRAQRYINQVKTEVSREIEMEELRKMQQEMQSAAQSFEQSVTNEIAQVAQDIDPSSNIDTLDSYYHRDYSQQALDRKAKAFRRKKIAKTSNIPTWYKSRHGQRSCVISGSARMAKHRVKSAPVQSFFS
ncbi:MAG: Sec-independent protein translocase protein TatB [Undibacterium sp.]|nr:Sec-independent protein translocase protein TatB [Undibacterium sp.]